MGADPPRPAPGPASELRRKKDEVGPSTEPRREAGPEPSGRVSSMLGRRPGGHAGDSFSPWSLEVSSSWRPEGTGLPAMDLTAGRPTLGRDGPLWPSLYTSRLIGRAHV